MRLNSVFKAVGLSAFALCLLASFEARAEVPLDGSFVAGANCTSFQSLKKQSNPVPLTAGQAYQIVAANKEAASYYMIVVPGANPERRWAPIGCGTRQGGTATTVTPAPAPDNSQQQGNQQQQGKPQQGKGNQRTQYVLAASWEAAFCETKPDKVECKSQTTDRFDASNFSLHGLWPQPRNIGYCKVERAQIDADKAGRWDQLPEVTLEPATRDELSKVMPGTQSLLERHEWTRHGTCYGTSQDEYFGDALALMRQLNGSAVQQLFQSHIGQFLSFDDIRKAFDQSFGEGAGRRVRMQCARDNGKLVISELTIGLTGEITPQSSLSDLIANAQPTKSECPGGIVDTVGHN